MAVLTPKPHLAVSRYPRFSQLGRTRSSFAICKASRLIGSLTFSSTKVKNRMPCGASHCFHLLTYLKKNLLVHQPGTLYPSSVRRLDIVALYPMPLWNFVFSPLKKTNLEHLTKQTIDIVRQAPSFIQREAAISSQKKSNTKTSTTW